MDSVSLDYKNTCQIKTEDLHAACNQLLPIIEHVATVRTTAYSDAYGSVNLPFDEELLKAMCAAVKNKKSLYPTTLVVIGIGGSNLGTVAVLQALRGTFYNRDQDIAIHFADTVDSDYIRGIAEYVEQELETGNNIVLNVISKSGNTTETIANFEFFLEILKNHRPYNYHQFVVATTDEHSPLWHLAQAEEFTILPIPKNVGGRYSVLSAVGLFPLAMIGIDIKELCKGAQDGVVIATNKNILENYAAISAAIITHHYRENRFIHDTFLFSVALERLGAWYRQLSAESLGKAVDKKGNGLHIGLLPTISMGSTDLHSVAQLYFAGPDNRFTSFISVAQNNDNLELPRFQEYDSLVGNIQGKSLADIMNAILQGTQRAYKTDNRPFVTWQLPQKSAYYIGQYMQITMIQVMYIGYLFDINPFDQPEVERYKKETREILKDANAG